MKSKLINDMKGTIVETLSNAVEENMRLWVMSVG